MNVKLVAAAAALSTALLAGAAGAQTTLSTGTAIAVNNALHPALRGERGSSHNIAVVRRHLERLIDQLQRDRHDYDGHREKAIDLMQQARAQLLQAEEYDRSHPGM